MVKNNEFVGVDEKFAPGDGTQAKKTGNYSEPILGEKGRKRMGIGYLVLLITITVMVIAIFAIAIVNLVRGFNEQNEMIEFQRDTYNQMLNSIREANK